MGAGDVYAALVEYRDLCVAALADTPDGPPDCVYIDAGVPSWDTLPSLIVHAGGPNVADTFPLSPVLAPAHRISIMGEVDLLSMTATILRCAPPLTEDGALPDTAAHEAAALQTSSDLWAIWNWIKQRHREETFFPPDSRELFLDPAVSVNQQGGACGWQITIRVQMPGYKPGVDP